MPLRFLTALLGTVLVVGIGRTAPAQETEPAKTQGEAKAADVTPKAGTAKNAKRSTAKKKASAAPDDSKAGALETATFGGGCFWCMEAVFERVKGVKNVVSGYAGGNVPRPSYEWVETGLTGHAEVVQITYDPKVVTFDDLLKIFWLAHDPTTLNRQGPDFGTQYRSIILYHDDMQKKAAQKFHDKLTAAHAFSSPIVTQLVPLARFYPAERYHQNYYRTHGYEEYCQTVIAPKLQMMRLKLQSGAH